MTEIINIHNFGIKLQVVGKRKTIANDSQYNFDTKGIMNEGISLKCFLREVIRDYGSEYAKEFTVKVNDLSMEDRKILLSHLVEASEYEEYCSTPSKLQAGLTDNLESMQRMLNEMSHELYSEYLYSMGYKLENEYGVER